MTHTLDDLSDVLAEEPAGLRAPDLDAVLRDGHALRRRRTTARGLGATAAALVLVAGAVGATRLLDGPGAGTDGVVAVSPDAVADQVAAARAAQERVDARVGQLIGPGAPEVGAWSATRPDGDVGSRALPRNDREWATLVWLRYTGEVGTEGYRAFVLTDNGPDTAAEAAAAEPGVASDRFCTNVYARCETSRVAGGVVAVERGRTDDGRVGVRASFTPDDVTRSWVLVEVTSPAGSTAYPAKHLVDLAQDPQMSLPSPLSPDELPDEG